MLLVEDPVAPVVDWSKPALLQPAWQQAPLAVKGKGAGKGTSSAHLGSDPQQGQEASRVFSLTASATTAALSSKAPLFPSHARSRAVARHAHSEISAAAEAPACPAPAPVQQEASTAESLLRSATPPTAQVRRLSVAPRAPFNYWLASAPSILHIAAGTFGPRRDS